MKKRRFFAGLLAVLLSLLMGCAQQPQQVQYTLPESGVTTNRWSITISWPYFTSLEQLTDAATDIFEGKVTRIYSDVIGFLSVKAVSKHREIIEQEEEHMLCLATVYEVETTRFYKGEAKKKMYIVLPGGIDDPDMLAEQYHVMVDAGIYNDTRGMNMRTDEVDIRLGESYLFCAKIEDGWDYHTFGNVWQGAFPLDDTSPPYSGGFTYSQIREYLLNNPQK